MRCLWGWILLLSGVAMADARSPFVLSDQHTAAGSQHAWMQAVADTAVPITVIHGSLPGPVLTLTAGIHGDEFPAIFALHQLKKMLVPAQLHGTLVLVHLANLQGFHGRRIALNPVDEKNLNRVFPGRDDGSQTEKIAYFLTQHIIAKTDYLIDLHAGSANQTLLPHVYSPVMHQPALDEKTLALAKSLGIPHIVLYDERPHDPLQSISYPNTAQTRGKPGITLEVGQLGQRSGEDIAVVTRSCLNAMQHLHMLEPTPTKAIEPVLYRQLAEVTSPVTGLYFPLVSVGETVAVGQAVGRVEDYFGQALLTLHAPVSGTVLMQNATPPIRTGEATTEIGVVR